MGAVFSYSLYSSILLSLLYLSYKWALAGENQHTYNRTALWLIYVVALCTMPFMKFASALMPSVPAAMPEIEIGAMDMAFVADGEAAAQPLWLTVLLWAYVAGMVLTLGQTLWIASRLRHIVSAGEIVSEGRFRIVLTDDTAIAPFSWWRYVVMSRRDWEESGRMILTHELQHLGLRHWIDLLVAQLVGIFQWYNPAAWLMREELKTVHEYQADRAVLDSGVPARDYQMLLIKKAVGARFPSLANSLNHSKLKKRITMMYNQNSSVGRRLRGLALVPALAAAIAVTDVEAVASVIADVSSAEMALPLTDSALRVTPKSSSETVAVPEEREVAIYGQGRETVTVSTERKDSENAGITQSESRPAPQETAAAVSDEPQKQQTASADNLPDKAVFFECEQKPEFPGGEVALMKYIAENIRYPQNAHDNHIEGRVVVSFVIQKDGTVGKTKIVRSVDSELDAEALRVVRSLPAFTPGEMNGKAVAVWYTIPIAFKLKGTDTAKKDDGLSSRPASVLVNGRPVVMRDGEKVYVDVYVDGKLFDGRLDDLDPSAIQEIRVEKGDGDKKDVIYITLKK